MSTFLLKGCWIGALHAPDRYFRGTVEEPGETGLRLGDPVIVKFENNTITLQARLTPASGRYSLEGMPSSDFVLASFIRKDGEVSREADQPGEEQLWGGDLFTRQPGAQPTTS
ncbi:hypothetical protein DKM44_00365 [Deinococcus irradiatisoli]|uniref:Uncharacterized protein n=1 Tax=Deinococcus irradiatisoli TaxID=2202254 RepID=A0A2Z3JG57_9DEIO|nr:hypothetical protein [Deinococcus irradiatisoli]AWN21879.1 hypothetical protein DKM44_00365 [Deinococcus irradiatisoli]